jgi:carbon monoxide dehydrogenase subunit G
MVTYELDIFINRPPQEVWDFYTNPANHNKFSSMAESAEWISEKPHGVGSTYRGVGKALGRKIESTNEITSWDPPNKYGYKSIGGSIPFETTYTFESSENGTKLSVYAQLEIGGFFKIAEGLAGKQAKKQLDADFEALRLYLEAGEM